MSDNNKLSRVDIDSEILKLLKLRSKGNNTYYTGTILGISIGAIFCIFGLVISIMGLTGSIEWIFEASDFKSRISNAGPGVIFGLFGMIIIWRYKPKVRDSLTIDDNKIIHDNIELSINREHKNKK